jgi:hypothetical protein
MIITITSNTANFHDNGKVSLINPLDFVVNYNYGLVSYYSLNSTFTIKSKSDHMWDIIKEGENESHGMDTALSRFYTTIIVTGIKQHEKINFEIGINHYEGLGKSILLNKIIHEIRKYDLNLNEKNINFLNLISGS